MARHTDNNIHRSRSPRKGRRRTSKKPSRYDIDRSFRKVHPRHIGEASDGALYMLMRECMAKKDGQRADEYRSRLSPSKQISLNGLLQRVEIVKCLDDLSIFPGVLDGFELGNVHKHLGLHCDEYITQFLGPHVKGVWSEITGGDPTIAQHVDTTTVRRLQFRAPAASSSDRRMIVQMFKSGDIFKGIADAETREQVKQNVLTVKVVIPSVESFHENMKFFSIGIKIIRDTIADSTTRGNWLTAFLKSWKPPAVPYIETAHGHLKPLAVPELKVQVAFLQLLLAALRNFPYLSSEHPRQDRRGESMPAYALGSMVLYFSELASELGFANKKIERNLEQNNEGQAPVDFQPAPGVPADWRGGKPFTKTFFTLRSQAFLLKLSKPMAQEVEPSQLFILRDFIKAFFGDLETLSLDKDRSSITLATGVVSERYTDTSHGRDAITRAEKSRMTKRRAKRKSRVIKRRMERVNGRKNEHGVEKAQWMTTQPRRKLANALISNGRQRESRSVTPFSTDEDASGTGKTFIRPFYRSPILSPADSARGLPTPVAAYEFSEHDPSGPDTEASTGDLNHRMQVESTPSKDTLGRASHRSPMGSFSVLGPQLSNETTHNTLPFQAGSSRTSILSQSTGVATATEPDNGEGGGVYTMPSRSIRSHFGQGFTRDLANTVRIPPIRSMRSARNPRLGRAAFGSPTVRHGARAQQKSPKDASQKSSGVPDHDLPFGRRRTVRTGVASPVGPPPTPLRPEASFPRGTASSGQGARTPWGTPSESEGERRRSAGTRRHAVYIPDVARQTWLESGVMPFDRPVAVTTLRRN